MESIIHDSLSHYLLSNNFLSDHQHGFIKIKNQLKNKVKLKEKKPIG